MIGVGGDVIPAGVLYLKSKLDDFETTDAANQEAIYKLAEKSLKRNGLVLNDKEILEMMEKKLSGKYIPVALKKSKTKNDESIYTKTSLSSMHTLEEFGALRRQIEDTVTKLAQEMRSGKADCRPLKNKSYDNCKYCSYLSVCRNSNAFESKEKR